MSLRISKGQVMCQDQYKCEFERCKHFDWHKERSSCKPRKCSKTGDNVRCAPTSREK